MEIFIQSDLFLKYWITEYEIPLAAERFNLNIDVLFITNTQGMNRSYLSKYEGSQPLRDVVQLVCHLNHYSALVDRPNQNDVEHHTPPKPLDREEFPFLVPRTREPDPCILTFLPDHVGTTEHLGGESTKIPDDTTIKNQPTKEVSFNDKDHVRYFTRDTPPCAFDQEEHTGQLL